MSTPAESAAGAPVRHEESQWALLALMRFGLSAIVAVGHLGLFLPGEAGWIHAANLLDGKAAVIGFLMISGYSIHASLEREPDGFLLRRFLRVYPLYFLCVLFTCLVEFGTAGEVVAPHAVFTSLGPVVAVGNLLMLQMFVVKTIAFNGPLWSLSIEFFYYVLANYFGRRIKAALVVGGISVVFFLLPRTDALGPLYTLVTKMNFVTYFWPWLFGFLLWKWTSPMLIVGGAVGAAALAMASAYTSGELAFLTCGAVVVLIYLARHVRFSPGWVRAFDVLGGLSYPLYLVHYPLLILLFVLTGATSPVPYVLASLAASALLYYGVDKYVVPRYLKPLARRRLVRRPIAG